ncbi:hypothetical protein SRB17_89360 [Streptomyces sp. RB17]|nr:hypothetical protein [Streptomyces sp. RB17]
MQLRVVSVRFVGGHNIAFRVQTLEAGPEPRQGPEVGIDAGVNVPRALSNEDHQEHGRPPRLPEGTADRDKWLTEKEKAKLLTLERQAAHQKSFRKKGEKTSRRLQHTYDQIKQLRAKATRRALDWQHQTTTYLACTYGTVVVEQLNILGMTKAPKPKPDPDNEGNYLRNGAKAKAGTNRSITQEAWGRTVMMLTYKLARCGGELVKVPAPYTSQRCSACGFITQAAERPKSCSRARTPSVGGPETPTGTRPGTSCTCIGSATSAWRSRPPEGAVVGRVNPSSLSPKGRRESPS